MGRGVFPRGRRVFPSVRGVFPVGRGVFPKIGGVFPMGRGVFPAVGGVFPMGREVFLLGRGLFPACGPFVRQSDPQFPLPWFCMAIGATAPQTDRRPNTSGAVRSWYTPVLQGGPYEEDGEEAGVVEGDGAGAYGRPSAGKGGEPCLYVRLYRGQSSLRCGRHHASHLQSVKQNLWAAGPPAHPPASPSTEPGHHPRLTSCRPAGPLFFS